MSQKTHHAPPEFEHEIELQGPCHLDGYCIHYSVSELEDIRDNSHGCFNHNDRHGTHYFRLRPNVPKLIADYITSETGVEELP